MSGLVRITLACALLSAGAVASCGKDSGGAAAPRTESSPEPVSPEPQPETASPKTVEPAEPRVELSAEFHRARFGLGSGFWVLGVVHNPHAERVADVRVQVALLDENEAVLGEAEGRVGRPLAAGERAAVAVHVAQPIEHEQLRLAATAILDRKPAAEPLPLQLEHEQPQRADLGGWYILGKVHNPSAAVVEGARIEIQGLDRSGELLGIDWLALDPVPAGQTIEFDVGELRYEEAPARFLLELRGPAVE